METRMNKAEATVLVVEDDADTRETLGFVIRKEGHRVVCLRNGQEALDYLRRSPPPNLVLLDLTMPIMSGWQFLEERRNDPRLASVPVVVLSVAAGQDVLALPGEVDLLLQKPASLHSVLAVVEGYCDRNV